jgi:uncharacterized protein YdhG (YjbR/CyaY superfamily)
MAKTNFLTIDDYINSRSEDEQKALQAMRKAIRKAVPDAEEVISYSIPAFKYHGFVFYISAYAKHYSLACPPPLKVFEKFKKELTGLEIGKSSLTLPKSMPLPLELIEKMAAFRAAENLKNSSGKGAKK